MKHTCAWLACQQDGSTSNLIESKSIVMEIFDLSASNDYFETSTIANSNEGGK
jgi:hypothetical protein